MRLAPCPKCGGDTARVLWDGRDKTVSQVTVFCAVCDAAGPWGPWIKRQGLFSTEDTERMAAAAWNEAAKAPATMQRVGAALEQAFPWGYRSEDSAP